MNCDAFLADPRETLSRLNTFFDLDFSTAKLDAVASGPLLSQNAKDTAQSFGAERSALAEAIQTVEKSLGRERICDRLVSPNWGIPACR